MCEIRKNYNDNDNERDNVNDDYIEAYIEDDNKNNDVNENTSDLLYSIYPPPHPALPAPPPPPPPTCYPPWPSSQGFPLKIKLMIYVMPGSSIHCIY